MMAAAVCCLVPSRRCNRPDLPRYASGSLQRFLSLDFDAAPQVEERIPTPPDLAARREEVLARLEASCPVRVGGDPDDAARCLSPRHSLRFDQRRDSEILSEALQQMALQAEASSSSSSSAAPVGSGYTAGYSAYNVAAADDGYLDVLPAAADSDAAARAHGSSSSSSSFSPPSPRIASRLDLFHNTLSSITDVRLDPTVAYDAHLEQYEALKTVCADFVAAATLYGRVIVSELTQPEAVKTVRPFLSSGVLGGEKFRVAGLFIKYSCDKADLFGSEEAAQKVARHELRSLATVASALTAAREANADLGLRYPLLALVHYRGFSLIVLSELPLSRTSLVAGSDDAGRTVQARDPDALAALARLARGLNLKPHALRHYPDVKFATPVDLECHLGEDGWRYLLDFSRLLPCTLPSDDVRGGHLIRLFRREFLASYPAALNSDSFSSFLPAAERAEAKAEIARAHRVLLEERLPQFAAELDALPAPAVGCGFARDRLFQNLSTRSHFAGINVRFFGAVRRLCRARFWRLALLMSMVTRRLKALHSALMRRAHLSLGGCHGGLLLSASVKASVDFLNLVFGAGPATDQFWTAQLHASIVRYFGPLDDYPPGGGGGGEVAPRAFRAFVVNPANDVAFGGTRVLLQLFLSFVKKAAMPVEKRALSAVRENPELLGGADVPFPFDTADLRDVPTEVRVLPVVSFSRAKAMRLRAMASHDAQAWSLNSRAARLFAAALEQDPRSSSNLRNLAESLGCVDELEEADRYFRLALQLQPAHSKTLFKRATFLESIYRVREAEESYLAALDSRQRDAHRLCTYADFLFAVRGTVRAALRVYELALRLTPTHAEALHNLGLLLMGADPARAEVCLRAALRYSTEEEGAHRAACARDLALFLQHRRAHCSSGGGGGGAGGGGEPVAVPRALPHSGPRLLHSTMRAEEITEIRRILGPKRAFEVRQVRLSDPELRFAGPLAQGTDPVAHAEAKVRHVHRLVAFPVSTECVYISVGGGTCVLGSEFSQLDPAEFARAHAGERATVGVVVAYTRNGRDVALFADHLEGTMRAEARGSSGWGWDPHVEIAGFAQKTIGELDAGSKAMLNFRRRPYLQLWERVEEDHRGSGSV